MRTAAGLLTHTEFMKSWEWDTMSRMPLYLLRYVSSHTTACRHQVQRRVTMNKGRAVTMKPSIHTGQTALARVQ